MSFQAPKGVSEYVPPRSVLFEEARDAFVTSARRACCAPVETAVFEDTGLFVRGVGESSGVVRKTHRDAVRSLLASLEIPDRIVLAVESERGEVTAGAVGCWTDWCLGSRRKPGLRAQPEMIETILSETE